MEDRLKEYFNNIDNIDNLFDLLEEWSVAVGPKELEDQETGFNDDRLKEFYKLLYSLKAEIKVNGGLE